ncbi:hypothetical protein TSUD_320930 [Trifolium subterraneum]|uniref:Replication factor A C-terminal domain-containing protein n=1 Tax=Trifolium subterraneum TaxID=3900 RepID=A0A2Z6N7P2_TRISU|nr:hypothetical protein TSUD_320930 [Trifolium subterraneum]
MANSGMYVKMTKISEITGGKIDFQLRVRVINLWATPDRNNPAEDGAINMIFLDKDCGKIHAVVRKDLISQFKDDIEEGAAYVIERFMVAKNDSSFKTTPHKHKLNFMRGTKAFKVTANEIPTNHFNFMPFQEILACTKEDQYLDVIGHVVEKNSLKETEKNGNIHKVMDVTLEDLEGSRIHCTLWADYAVKMQQFIDGHDSSLPVIMVLQLGKLKKYLGEGSMGISNSFYGTKLFLNAQIPEVTTYIERMIAANVELTQVVSQMSGPVIMTVADDLLQTPRMTIEDLIESNQKCFGSVLAWAYEFDTDAGWFYQACTRCASRITFIVGQLYCDKCKMPRTAIPRFKVHLQVIDDTGSITFIMFDRVVSQVLGRTAQDLLDTMNNEGGSRSYPPELDVFVDKRMLFKVEVTDANLYRNWRGYTVKKVTDEEGIIDRFVSLHGLTAAGNNEDANYGDFVCNLGDDTPLGSVEGGDSNNNEEIIVHSAFHTPTSKLASKESLDLQGIGASATKEPPKPSGDIALTNSPMHTPVKKPAGKRSANLDGGDDAASKETKLPCVKIEGAN